MQQAIFVAMQQFGGVFLIIRVFRYRPPIQGYENHATMQQS
jgi:hypothetical protein